MKVQVTEDINRDVSDDGGKMGKQLVEFDRWLFSLAQTFLGFQQTTRPPIAVIRNDGKSVCAQWNGE